jgi:hypothetical protein
MSFMLGSVTTAPSWHGLWLRLIEDTTPARGALASALATRMAAPIARDPPQPLPPQTAQNTLKDLEAKTFQREEPPTKPMVDNIFDFTLARQALEKLTDTTPRVAYNINAEPQQRKHAMTTADGFKSHAVFAITDIFEAKVPISSNNERDDFPFDDIADMMAYEACPDIMDPLFPDWSDKAAIELYYQEKVIQDGIGDYIIKPGDPDYEDPDFPFESIAELRFIADNFTSDDDEQIDNLLAYYRSGTTQ